MSKTVINWVEDERFHEAISSLTSATDREAVFRGAATSIAELTGCERIDAYRIKNEEVVLQFSAGKVNGEDCYDHSAVRTLASTAVEKGEPRIINDTMNCETDLLADADYRSVLVAPIGIGMVVIASDSEPNAFPDEILHLVDLITTYAENSVSNRAGATGIPETVQPAKPLLDLVDTMVIGIDTAGRITTTNERAREILGYEEGQLQGKDWFETCVPERVRNDVREVFENLVSEDGGPVDQYDNPVVTSDGEERIIQWRNTIYEDSDGNMGGTISAGRDVTEERERQRALERSERRYRTLVNEFPNGIVTLFDEDFRYQVVGGTIFDELPLEQGDLEGRTLQEVFPDENADRIEPLYEGAFEGESGTAEVTLDDRVFRIFVVPVHDESGDVFAGMTMSQDVTDEKERERALEATMQRYRTLLDSAPDPVFVADVETGEILETNQAAADLRGEPREAILGRDQTELHPTEDSEAYRQLFERHVDDGGTKRRLPDGSQIEFSTSNGETIPVEISVETVELPDGAVIYGVFRDISERVAYEHALTAINEVTRDLFTAETHHAIEDNILAVLREILRVPMAVFYRFNGDEGRLEPAAFSSSPDCSVERGNIEPVEPNSGPIWDGYIDGHPLLNASLTSPANEESSSEKGVIVPVADYGVLVGHGVETVMTDNQLRALVDVLGTTTAAALEHVDRLQELQDSKRRLETRNTRLEALETVNARIRNVAGAIVESDTRSEIENAVCAELAKSETVSFAWIAAVDQGETEIEPRAMAGPHTDYVEGLPRSFADQSLTEPAFRAARSQKPVFVPNIAEQLPEEPWRKEALRHDFRSAIGLPLVYQDSLLGILTLYSDEPNVFSSLSESILEELTELVAHSLASIDRKQALLSNQFTELEFDISGSDCFFYQLANDAECSFELAGVAPRFGNSSEIYLRILDGDPDRVLEKSVQFPEIHDARLIDTENEPVILLEFMDQCIAGELADQGILTRSISADSTACRITVAIPPSFELRRVVEIMTSRFEEAKVLAKRDKGSDETPERGLAKSVLGDLTPRQREIIELAFVSGYFDSPKKTNGTELAEQFDISSSAVHNHIRSAERKLLEAVFGSVDSNSNAPTRNTGER